MPLMRKKFYSSRMWKLRYLLNDESESTAAHLKEMQMDAIKRRQMLVFDDDTIGIFIGVSSEMNYGEP